MKCHKIICLKPTHCTVIFITVPHCVPLRNRKYSICVYIRIDGSNNDILKRSLHNDCSKIRIFDFVTRIFQVRTVVEQ